MASRGPGAGRNHRPPAPGASSAAPETPPACCGCQQTPGDIDGPQNQKPRAPTVFSIKGPGGKPVAEGEGFEPPDRLPRQRFSRPPPSTARPPLRRAHSIGKGAGVVKKPLAGPEDPRARRCGPRRGGPDDAGRGKKALHHDVPGKADPDGAGRGTGPGQAPRRGQARTAKDAAPPSAAPPAGAIQGPVPAGFRPGNRFETGPPWAGLVPGGACGRVPPCAGWRPGRRAGRRAGRSAQAPVARQGQNL